MISLPRNLRLCMDGRMLVAPGTGVSSYARALREAHRALSDHPLLLSAGVEPNIGRTASMRRVARALNPGSRHVTVDDSGGRLVVDDLFRTSQIFFNIHHRLLPVRVPGDPGIMHWSYPVPISLVGWDNIYTIHDAIPTKHPDLTMIDARRHRRLVARIAERASRIVTVSQAARDDIIATTRCPASQVVDCSQPVDIGDLPPGANRSPRSPRSDYLLVCGSVEPRKNIAGIVAAYRRSKTGLPLVIVGPDGWRAESLGNILATTPGVIRIAYCDRSELMTLISNARALLMPSLAEGFGLPVAEAMALGTPVMTSDSGALAETAGGAALLVDPTNVAAMADAIARLSVDDALCARLSARGLIQARRFDRHGFDARLAALYADVIASSARAPYRAFSR